VEPAGPASPLAAEAAEAAEAVDLGPILPWSEPVALDVPSIGVHSGTLVPLEVGTDGVLPAPADHALPGWHTRGPAPGQLGPAVIAGHVDGPSGPAVFYRLGDLAVGDLVQVTRRDGTIATFEVDAVERYAKDAFPTSRVYGNTTDRAELRLITCGGEFDRTTGHYVDNVVAFAHLVG
jgi:sortase (surface protein transpeptidase)